MAFSKQFRFSSPHFTPHFLHWSRAIRHHVIRGRCNGANWCQRKTKRKAQRLHAGLFFYLGMIRIVLPIMRHDTTWHSWFIFSIVCQKCLLFFYDHDGKVLQNCTIVQASNYSVWKHCNKEHDNIKKVECQAFKILGNGANMFDYVCI